MTNGVVNGDIVSCHRIELGRAGKLNGNIQTPSLQIEQCGIFEGSCKMVQQKAATEKSSKVERKDNVIDAGKLEPVKVETAEDASNRKPAVAVGGAAG